MGSMRMLPDGKHFLRNAGDEAGTRKGIPERNGFPSGCESERDIKYAGMLLSRVWEGGRGTQHGI